MLADCHTHTVHSPRGTHTAAELCEAALLRGADILGISDHCECNRYYKTEFYTNNPNSFDSYDNRELFLRSLGDIEMAKEKYGGALVLLAGTELGQATFDIAAAEETVGDKRLDFVIGSMHQIPCCDDFCGLSYTSGEYADMALQRYFSELIRLSAWGGFDILGHITYPLRYIEGVCGIKTDISRYEELIRQIFSLITEKGIALEINTSGLRLPYGRLLPDRELIALYAEMGGEYVSIGSDSHTAENILDGCELAAEAALSCGIGYGVYFKERKPVPYRLEGRSYG